MVLEVIQFNFTRKFGKEFSEITFIGMDIVDNKFYFCLVNTDSEPSSKEFAQIITKGKLFNFEGKLESIDDELIDTFHGEAKEMIKKVDNDKMLFVHTWNVPVGIEIFLF